MANLQDFRQKYPEYSDLTDGQLAEGLYKKSYSDMDRADFNKRIGFNDNPDGSLAFGVDQAQSMTGSGIQTIEDVLPFNTHLGDSIVAQQEKDIKEGGYVPTYKGSLTDQKSILDMGGWLVEKSMENAAMVVPGLGAVAAAAVTAPVSGAAALGILATGAVASGIMNTGDVAQEMKEQGVYDAKVALAAGTVAGALDMVGAGKVVPKGAISYLVKLGLKKKVAEELVTEAAKTGITKEIAKRVVAEASTEALQESVAMLATASQGGTYKWKDVANRLVDAAALGGVAGGVVAAPSIAIERSGVKEEAAANITPEDHASPIPDDLISKGKEIMGTPAADDILGRNSDLKTGQRVTVNVNGEEKTGTVEDAFSTEVPELGKTSDGIKIRYDDGSPPLDASFEAIDRLNIEIDPIPTAADVIQAAAPTTPTAPAEDVVKPAVNQPAERAPAPVAESLAPVAPEQAKAADTPPVAPEQAKAADTPPVAPEVGQVAPEVRQVDAANKILEANNVPKVGERVTVDHKGAKKSGTVVDAYVGQRLGKDTDFFQIQYDDGSKPYEFAAPVVKSLGIKFSPENQTSPPVQNVQKTDNIGPVDTSAAAAPEAVIAPEIPVAEDVAPDSTEPQYKPLPKNAKPPKDFIATKKQMREFQKSQKWPKDEYGRPRTVVPPTRKGPSRDFSKTDMSVLEFIASNGGIRDDEGHNLKRGRDANKGRGFIPGVGPIVRKSGRSVDGMGEALGQAGYFGYDEDGNFRRPTESEILDAIEEGLFGNDVYPEGSQARNDMMLAQTDDHYKQQYEQQFEEETVDWTDDEKADFWDRIANQEALIDQDSWTDQDEKNYQARYELMDAWVDSLPDSVWASGENQVISENGTSTDRPSEEKTGGNEGSRAEGETAQSDFPGDQPNPDGKTAAEKSASKAEPLKSEKTSQGEQTLTPGVAPITDRQRIEQKTQGKKTSDKTQKAPDEGLFDVNGRKQTDAFSRREGLTPKAEENIDAVEKALNARLSELGLSNKVGLKLVEAIKAKNEDGSFSLADGVFYKNLIRIAMDATKNKDWVLHHEAVHALKSLGVFRSVEWKTLVDAAKANKSGMEQVRADYADAGLTEAQIHEEVVANMFANYVADRNSVSRPLQRAFRRAANFFKAVKNAMKGQGFQTSDDIFRSIDKGDVGNREATQSGTTESFARKGGPEFANEEVKKRYEEASGITGPNTLRDKINNLKDHLQHVADNFTRHYEHLPTIPKYANVKEQLRKLEAAHDASRDKVLRILKDLTKDMTPADFALFERKVIFDDLSWEAGIGHDLPFGLKSQDDVNAELDVINRALAVKPEVMAAVRKRQAISEDVVKDLLDAGVLTKEQVSNPSYYRHMVLEYARAQRANYSKSTPGKLRETFWHGREGSDKDINTNYLEAEFDWLHKAYTDVAVAKTIDHIKKSEHNIRDSVLAAAKAHNETEVQKILAGDPALETASKAFKRNIAIGFDNVKKAIKSGQLVVPAEYRSVAQKLMYGGSISDSESVLPFLAYILDNGLEGSIGAATVFKYVNAQKTWRKGLLGDKYANPMNIDGLIKMGFAPEGHVSWQPQEGKILFTAQTLSESSQARLLRTIADSPEDYMPADIAGIVGAELKEVLTDTLVVGGDRYKMILPEELAHTLDTIRDPDTDNLIVFASGKILRSWKIWTLINPRRFIKYNLNNLSGDLDAVIAGNPQSIKRWGQAFRELKSVMLQGGRPSADMQEAIERGVIDSGLTLQEIPDVNDLAEFDHLLDPSGGNPVKITAQTVGKAWRGMKKVTMFRENIARYAAYLDYRDRINAGEDPVKIGFGASIPEIVDMVTGTNDRAALLARELVGDYGNVSHYGQGIRKHFAPFYSWMEINTKRYWRLNANAWKQGGFKKGIPTTAGLTLAKGARTTAYLYIRMAVFYGAVQAFNNIFFGDDEDDLDEESRARLHLNLGRWGGEIQTIRIQGALSDYLGWFGFEDVLGEIFKIESGRADFSDVGKSIAKAPVNRLVSSVRPDVKTPIELFAGQSFYPDVFTPRSIKDGWRHVARTISMENEYDLLAGKPSRGYLQSWKNSVLYSRDPGENAYNRVRGLAYDFNNDRLGIEGSTNYTTAKSRVVYYWKTAKRYGDKEAEAKYLLEMKELGVNRKDLAGYIKRANPLQPVPLKERNNFMATLSAKDKEVLKSAMKWYEEVYR